jgi:hypothetical protein
MIQVSLAEMNATVWVLILVLTAVTAPAPDRP